MCLARAEALSHCAEHVELPTLNEFMTPWLGLVQHHPSQPKEQMAGEHWHSHERLFDDSVVVA